MVGGDCCGLPGWQTIYQLDFTTEATQNLAANGTYTIGGLAWQRQNAAHDQAAMVLTNGTGLVISPDQTSDYINGTRTAPLIWTPLSAIVPANADWNSGFRIWVDSPTDPPLPDPGPNGFIFLTGLDSNSMDFSNVGMRGCVAGQTVQGMLSRTTINSSSLHSATQFRLTPANRTFAHYIRPGTVQEGIEGSIYSGAETLNLASWPSPQLIKPQAGSVSFADAGMNAPATPFSSTLGIVIGAFRAGNVNFQAVTIARLRVDVRIVGP